ncbi:MAG: DUF1156 domain-containing protein [Microscillaceae bacterium]|jgi:putative DNA methylase|nr:DUF1156 domain-containing protein [Microscillaceae bacterium]
MQTKLTYKLISEIGVQEKYIRKDHFNTLKVWWARRPITTMRSLLIKEILKRNPDFDINIDYQLFAETNPPSSTYNSFKETFKTYEMKVLDIFAGGGSIPFESARLGFKTYASELNPVASLAQETIFNSINIPNYSEKLKKVAYQIIDKMEAKLGQYYVFAQIKPYVIFWAKVAKCKNCGNELSLRRLEFLSKRKSRPVRIWEENDNLLIINDLKSEDNSSKEFTCKKCQTSHNFKDIKDYCKDNQLYAKPFAFCYVSNGKKYKTISQAELAIFDKYNEQIQQKISTLSHLIPNQPIKTKGGVINPTLYDLKLPEHFFNSRQLLVLLTLIDEIIQIYPTLITNYQAEEAQQICLGLTSLIEFLVDWNSTATMWISQNEQTGRSLAGPGVGMKWDFIELNPFAQTGSNLKSKIDRVCNTFQSIKFNNPINIIKGSSTDLPLEDETIDIVLTDPPYYDSIDYTGLSEFFRPWFEVLIRNTFNTNINLKNQDDLEAIVELSKNGAKTKDHQHYQKTMTSVLSETYRVLKKDGSLLMLYSHKTYEGWEVIAYAFKSSGLYISEVIPLEMERIARPRAMASEALNGVVVFRLQKNITQITNVETDIINLKNQLISGEILDSQIVISLAALACKQVTLTNTSYQVAYEEVVRQYEKNRLDNWEDQNIDMITKSYLYAKLKGSVEMVDNQYLEILRESNLLINNRLKSLEEINFDEKVVNTLLETAIKIYNNFQSNSKTKVVVSKNERENIKTFYSILSGLSLNTVAKRSSDKEAKVARLVLAKMN